jgi:hypothetical protein
MNIKKAFLEHMDWEINFLSQVFSEQHFQGQALENEQGCPFGQWLREEGKNRYDSLATYQQCVDRHADLHHEAVKIALAINAERYDDANAMLGVDSPFSVATLEAFNAYLRLKQDGDNRLKTLLSASPSKTSARINRKQAILDLMIGHFKE